MTAVPAASPAETPSTSGPAGPRHRRGVGALIVVALLATAVVRALLVQSYFIPSASMQPALQPGDRIVVAKAGAVSGLERGDVVVFDGTRIFAGRSGEPARSGGIVESALGALASLLSVDTGESDYVKRVIGLPGDHVVCCDQDGAMTVNGVQVDEPYRLSADAASDVSFDVIVPAGRIWVMGDHRSASADSRAHLGDPGGGMVPLTDVVGRAVAVYWPLDHLATLPRATELSGIPEGRGAR